MTTALVTGAAGLLGRATVAALADGGVEVHALVRSADQGFRPDVAFLEADLARPLSVSALPARIDTVYHLAQAREFRDFPGSAATVFAINTASTAFLLDYSTRAGASSFVYASSGGVYSGAGSELTEDSPLQTPETLGYYLATKLASEALVHSYSGLFATTALRYFFIYGPGQARSMLLPRLYDRVRSGEPLSLQGEQGMRINPVHVADAAVATIAAGGLAGRTTVNVAGPETLSLREVGELFAADCGVEPRFEHSDALASDLVASTARMAQLLVAPTRTLADSLGELRGA